jgi:hypothetical protein
MVVGAFGQPPPAWVRIGARKTVLGIQRTAASCQGTVKGVVWQCHAINTRLWFTVRCSAWPSSLRGMYWCLLEELPTEIEAKAAKHLECIMFVESSRDNRSHVKGSRGRTSASVSHRSTAQGAAGWAEVNLSAELAAVSSHVDSFFQHPYRTELDWSP